MELGNKATISLADFRLLLFGNATLHFVVFNFRMKHTYLHPERLINENGNTLLCMVLLLQEDVQREGDLEKCDEDDVQLLNVSAEEVKSMMETVAKDTLTSYQVQISQKLREREASLLNRISKLEKQSA